MARKVIVGGVGKSPSIDKINAALSPVDGCSGGGVENTGGTAGFNHVYAKELGTISRSKANYIQVPIDFCINHYDDTILRSVGNK